jgi:hypothetical protein
MSPFGNVFSVDYLMHIKEIIGLGLNAECGGVTGW